MTKRDDGFAEIGGVMIALGVIWLGLSGVKPGWGGITALLPGWVVQPMGGLVLALSGALLVGRGRRMARTSAPREKAGDPPHPAPSRPDTPVTPGPVLPSPVVPSNTGAGGDTPKARVFTPAKTAAPMIRRAGETADVVWMSDLDTIGHDRAYTLGDPAGSKARLDACAALNFQGDVVPPIILPKAVRPLNPATGEIDPTDHEYEGMATLGEVNLLRDRFLLVGPRVAAVLSRADLGAGALHPVAVLDHRGAVMSERDYFFWNFGNRRACLLPDESTGLRRSTRAREQGENAVWFLPVIPEGDSIALSRDCLTGPDVWREKHLNKGTFLSDRLMRDLRNAGLDHWFEPVRCRVV